jgi:hypothetical protein
MFTAPEVETAAAGSGTPATVALHPVTVHSAATPTTTLHAARTHHPVPRINTARPISGSASAPAQP